jgi:hypothetical protein
MGLITNGAVSGVLIETACDTGGGGGMDGWVDWRIGRWGDETVKEAS